MICKGILFNRTHIFRHYRNPLVGKQEHNHDPCAHHRKPPLILLHSALPAPGLEKRKYIALLSRLADTIHGVTYSPNIWNRCLSKA
jgi:hypothetical protein